MKSAGLAAICIALSLSGILYIGRKKKKAEVLYKFSLLFGELGDMSILCGGDIINAIMRAGKSVRLKNFPFLENFLASVYYGCNIKDVWTEVFRTSDEINIMDEKAESLIMSFPDFLGRNSAGSFSENCRNLSILFTKMKDEEEKLIEKKGSLAVYLGVLAAAAVFVVMI